MAFPFNPISNVFWSFSIQLHSIFCCSQFYSIPFLGAHQNLIYVDVESSSEDEESPEPAKTRAKASQHESSSDDNDSTAAAHAAAIGHSPVVLKSTAILTASMVPSLPEDIRRPSPPKLPDDCDTPDEKSEISHVLQPKPSIAAQDGTAADSSPKKNVQPRVGAEIHCKGSTESNDIPESGSNPPTRAGAGLEMSLSVPSNGAANMDVDIESPVQDSVVNGITASGDSAALPEERKVILPATRKAVRMKLNQNISLNERDEDENCAIHVAIHARKLEHVKILLEAGASFRMRSDGSLPIHTAVSIGSLAAHRQFAYECVVLLHEHGADLAVKDDAVHTPLFLACMSNLPQVVSFILSDEGGLETLNTRADRAGNRPLHAAAKFDTLDNPSLSIKASSSKEQTRAAPNHHHPEAL